MKDFFHRLSKQMPVFEWLPAYKREWLWLDIIAGLTLAAYAVPVAMAYASLAGLPPQAGLYGYILSGSVYALFATSRHLSVGPIASISVMVATVIGTMAVNDPLKYASLAAMAAAMVACLYFMAWVLRLNSFVNFISESILLGFKAGAALSIASMQLPKLIGVTGGGNNFFERILITFQQSGQAEAVVMLIGLTSLTILLAGHHFFPGWPVGLAVVAISTALVSAFALDSLGVKVVGFVPSGFPELKLPTIYTEHLEGLAELAFACFLLSYVESIASARAFASRHNYSIRPRQELLGLGAANLVASLGHGYPVAGGLSQSAVNERAGAKTPLSLIIAAASILTLLFFLSGTLKNLPECVLAAVVLTAVSGFVKISDFKRLREISRIEFNVALFALSGVLFLGILRGVTLSAIISILFLLKMIANPHIAVLGRIPGTNRFSDSARHETNELFPGLFLFRIEAPLLYFNVETVSSILLDKIRKEPIPVRLAICDLSTSPYIDSAGARMLQQLGEQLQREGVRLRVAEAHSEVRKILRITGISESLGGVSRHTALADMVEDYERDNRRSVYSGNI